MHRLLIELAVITAVLIGLYFWHMQDVTTKVEQARINEHNTLSIQYSKQAIKLQDSAYLAQVQLEQRTKRIIDDKNKQLYGVNTKYVDLLSWLSAQSNGNPRKQTSVSNSTSDSESTTGTNGQGLLQENANNTTRPDEPLIELIEFAKQTEELKVYLLSCYQQYDQVLEEQQRFRVDNTPRKP